MLTKVVQEGGGTGALCELSVGDVGDVDARVDTDGSYPISDPFFLPRINTQHLLTQSRKLDIPMYTVPHR